MGKARLLGLALFTTIFFICGCSGKSNYERAFAYQNDGEYNKAIVFYNSAIRKGEKVALCHKNLGDIFFGDKKYDRAFKHYKKSIEIEPEVVLETLMKYISYNDSYVREILGDTFFKIENERAQNKINNSLATILKSNDQYKVLDALAVATKMKEKIRPIAGDIIELLNSDNNIIKQGVLEIIPNIADIVVETEGFNKLIEFLSQNDEILKAETIKCLGNMKGYAINSLFDLINLAVNEDRYKEQVFLTIDKIGLPTKEQMEQMYSFLKDKPKDIKIHMLENFGNFGAGANIYVPYIMYFLDDTDSEIKQITRVSLTKIGKSSTETVPELIKLLQSENDEILSRAIYELGDLGKSASQAIEPLKQIAENSQKKDIKILAEKSLKKIQ